MRLLDFKSDDLIFLLGGIDMIDFLDYPFVPQMPYGITSADQYQRMMWETKQQIQLGLQAQCASTGYPIEMLWGGAHTNAGLAAIGGGAVNAGGSGVSGGLQILLQYAWAAGAFYESQRRLGAQWW